MCVIKTLLFLKLYKHFVKPLTVGVSPDFYCSEDFEAERKVGFRRGHTHQSKKKYA